MKILFLTISTLLILSACSTEQKETATEIKQVETSENFNPHGIELINGEKWKVDEGMMITIQSIAHKIKSFDGKTIEDYREYSTSLSNLISELTSNCTMKGQAHDELHKWLVPFIGLSKDLKKSEDIAELSKIDGELKSEIVVFEDYFE